MEPAVFHLYRHTFVPYIEEIKQRLVELWQIIYTVFERCDFRASMFPQVV